MAPAPRSGQPPWAHSLGEGAPGDLYSKGIWVSLSQVSYIYCFLLVTFWPCLHQQKALNQNVVSGLCSWILWFCMRISWSRVNKRLKSSAHVHTFPSCVREVPTSLGLNIGSGAQKSGFRQVNSVSPICKRVVAVLFSCGVVCEISIRYLKWWYWVLGFPPHPLVLQWELGGEGVLGCLVHSVDGEAKESVARALQAGKPGLGLGEGPLSWAWDYFKGIRARFVPILAAAGELGPSSMVPKGQPGGGLWCGPNVAVSTLACPTMKWHAVESMEWAVPADSRWDIQRWPQWAHPCARKLPF